MKDEDPYSERLTGPFLIGQELTWTTINRKQI